MPSRPASVRISANRNATSVIARCRPVSTFASLTAVAIGRITDDSVTDSIRSRTGEPLTATASRSEALMVRRPWR
jgi:hypothetical protein